MKNENNEIVKKNNLIYDLALKKYGKSSSSVLWDDQQTQYLRFAELVKDIDFNDRKKRLLDIGCGNGELYKYLNFQGFRGTYVGYDINKKLIYQAKERFGPSLFRVRDIMSENGAKQFDYVVMSGLFNTNVGQSVEWIEKFIQKMFEYCKSAMSFNAISTHVTYKDPHMFYISPEKMLQFCIENLSPRVTISHHNLPYNYTITVFNDDNWQSINKVRK